MRQLTLDLLPEALPSLDNFVVGGNGEALTAFVAWLSPENRESSFFLWGEAGAGKTHLLRASGKNYIDAQLEPDLISLNSLDEAVTLWAIDHVDALNPQGEIALFNAFNRLRAAGGRLLTSSAQAPLQLTLREDLRTRLGSGLIYRLHALTDGEKIAALSAYASTRALSLPDETFDYLLRRAPRDMRSLMAVLAALDRYSLEHKRAITLPLLREVLQTA